jgi:NADPH-dependent F420 reductase
MTTDRGTVIKIAVLGGTGKEGSALGQRWALNGYQVIIGSRDAERAASFAAETNKALGGDYLTGTDNKSAAAAADIVVLSVPYSAHKATIESVKEHLAGKVLVDLTVPLNPPKVRTVHLPEGKAAALEAQGYVGENTRVVAAFQNVSCDKLYDPYCEVNCDVLVCGNDESARADVIKLAQAAGLRGIDAGPLANAIAVESLTPVLLYINKKYGVTGAGFRITGIE